MSDPSKKKAKAPESDLLNWGFDLSVFITTQTQMGMS